LRQRIGGRKAIDFFRRFEQRFEKGSVNLQLTTKDVMTFVTPTLVLYSTAEKPSSALVLQPGDSLRLRGTTLLPATAFGAEWIGSVTLLGHFCVSTVSVSSGETGSHHKIGGTSEGNMWCVNADQKYEVTFAPGELINRFQK
jgi:hypothetical protein